MTRSQRYLHQKALAKKIGKELADQFAGPYKDVNHSLLSVNMMIYSEMSPKNQATVRRITQKAANDYFKPGKDGLSLNDLDRALLNPLL